MSAKNNHNVLQAPLPDLTLLRDAASAGKIFLGFPTVALHMMITFYLTLLAFAIAAGEKGQCPDLMSFIIIWHLAAVPAWFLKTITLKMCGTPWGMFLFFLMLGILVFSLKEYLLLGQYNIGRWISEAWLEMNSP